MNATTAAIDLAKNVFQVALADANARVLEQHRLTRSQFERFFDNRSVARVIMEACGSAHHWARVFAARGIEVMLLPAHYVRAYVRRSKTDAADALALLEAARCADIVAVRVKSVEQQSLQALHRTRSLWMGTRTSRINALRGFCRELGLHVPVGARTGLEAIGRAVADDQSPIPPLLRPIMQQLLVGRHAPLGTYLRDGRPLPAHVAHARGALGPARGQSSKHERPRAARRAPMGDRAASAIQPQQDRLRAGQQDGAHLLRGAARPNPVRSAGDPAWQEDAAPVL